MEGAQSGMRMTRRSVVQGGLAVTSLLVAGGASAQQPVRVTWEDALKAIIGSDAKPVEGKIELTVPEIAESGNTVPFTVSVPGALSEKEYVKAVHVFADKNPRPDIASFFFSPFSGKAQAQSRMRLSETQNVIAVAELSDGKFYMTRREVKVTIGGCGG